MPKECNDTYGDDRSPRPRRPLMIGYGHAIQREATHYERQRLIETRARLYGETEEMAKLAVYEMTPGARQSMLFQRDPMDGPTQLGDAIGDDPYK
jgi:hypothetical protein